jgi:hypothetical protein
MLCVTRADILEAYCQFEMQILVQTRTPCQVLTEANKMSIFLRTVPGRAPLVGRQPLVTLFTTERVVDSCLLSATYYMVTDSGLLKR